MTITSTPGVTTSITRDLGDFKAAVSESFVPLNISGRSSRPFWARIRAADAGEVHVTEIAAAQHVVERTPDLIARAPGHYFKLSMLLAGTGLLIQDDREAVLRPGDFAVYDTDRPYTLAFDDEFRSLVVMFPQRFIDLPTDVVGRLTAVRIAGNEGLGSIVAPFLAQLAANLEQLVGASGHRLAQNVLDLISTTVADELDLGHANANQALSQRIRDYIEANLASTELSPAQIAAAHYISTRHLHGLFQAQGTTVSTWIRSRRLERCRQDLLNPLYVDRRVGAIAARWGFVDAAHFSRVFKAAYGQAPSEMRFGAA